MKRAFREVGAPTVDFPRGARSGRGCAPNVDHFLDFIVEPTRPAATYCLVMEWVRRHRPALDAAGLNASPQRSWALVATVGLRVLPGWPRPTSAGCPTPCRRWIHREFAADHPGWRSTANQARRLRHGARARRSPTPPPPHKKKKNKTPPPRARVREGHAVPYMAPRSWAASRRARPATCSRCEHAVGGAAGERLVPRQVRHRRHRARENPRCRSRAPDRRPHVPPAPRRGDPPRTPEVARGAVRLGASDGARAQSRSCAARTRGATADVWSATPSRRGADRPGPAAPGPAGAGLDLRLAVADPGSR